MKSRKLFVLSLFVALSATLFAQTGKPLRGIIVDQASGETLPSVSITLLNSAHSHGVISDDEGNFSIENLPVGRYDVQATYIGYEPMIFKDVVISSAKDAFITIRMRENINKLQEIVIQPQVNKQEPLNNIASVSAQMLSVEEASRYAGGYDDPARLVSAFAGVAGNVSNNGIAIRGNSPQFLQWKLEGTEIPNPTHFPDITGVGGGILTALSSQMLDNSDFFTGAFPAQYNNALSGVFDMNLRNGNRWNHEHTAQIGTMGLEFSSEGPFKKGGQASYLFNYRYATMALAGDIFGDILGNASGMRYQDLSFKLNFPMKKAGVLSIWGIGLIDNFKNKVEKDTAKWETADDNSSAVFKQTMGAGGIGHKYFINNDTYIKSAFSMTYSKNSISVDSYDRNMIATRINEMDGSNRNISFNTYINRKFNARHSLRTGLNISNLHYDMDYNISPSFPNATSPMENFAKNNGNTFLASAFTNSTIRLGNNVTTNLGLTGQYFFLNKNWTIEPRIGVQWQVNTKHSLGFAYGKHSRHEKLDYYFVTTPATGDRLINKNLDFAKAHHIVLSYGWSVSENMHLKVEPYLQYLYDVPVEEGSSFSIINHRDWYLNTALVNEGKGRNYGVDITLERYLADGYYYLLTASIFDSRYRGGDGVWRNTRLNRSYMFNALGGKEWKVGKSKQNTLGVNLRLSYQGGDRYSPINEEASQLQQDAVFDTSRAYEKQLTPAFISSFTTNYRINKKNMAHEFSIKIINATGYKEYEDHIYNYRKHEVEKLESSVVLPNISYKIEF